MYETTRLAIALRMGRAACGLTQQELAEELGVTKTVIARNEKPDMAMRADTLVRLIHVMRSREVEIDVFESLDSIRVAASGGKPKAAAMRMARAALNQNQQEFADTVGLSKAVVTRGERPSGNMRLDTMLKLVSEMGQHGIRIDWVPIITGVTVTVQRQAVEAIEALNKSSELPGEPKHELVPHTLKEQLYGEVTGSHRTE